MGVLTHKFITTYLFGPLDDRNYAHSGRNWIIVIIEHWTSEETRTITVETMTWKDSLVIGLAQTLSLIPGTSRAAATIMGAMLRGVKRASATEFSFLLAFPMMIAASAMNCEVPAPPTHDMVGMIMVGFITSFVVALAVVAWFIRYVQRHPFTGFGFYRIVFGAMVLALWAARCWCKEWIPAGGCGNPFGYSRPESLHHGIPTNAKSKSGNPSEAHGCISIL